MDFFIHLPQWGNLIALHMTFVCINIRQNVAYNIQRFSLPIGQPMYCSCSAV